MATPLDRRLAKAAAPLFAPLGVRIVLRLEQVEYAEFAADAALASFSLRSALGVLEADAIAVAFDTWAEAEAAGRRIARTPDGGIAEPGKALDMPVDAESALEAAPLAATAALTRRVCEEIGEAAAVLGTMCGPATLLTRLHGAARGDDMIDAAARLAAKSLDMLCGAGVAAVVLLEEEPAEPALFARFDAAFNLARYYQVPVLYLSCGALSGQAADSARAAGATWAVGPGDADGAVAAIPLAAFAQDGDFGAGWKAALPDTVRLLVSAWEIPAQTGAETILRVRNVLVG